MKILRLIIFLLVILFFYTSNLAAQFFYTDPEDLEDDVKASTNGGIFIVKDGTYDDFEATFEVVATPENPVIIKAQTLGGVTLTGESHFVLKMSAHVIIDGFVFDEEGDDTLIKFEECILFGRSLGFYARLDFVTPSDIPAQRLKQSLRMICYKTCCLWRNLQNNISGNETTIQKNHHITIHSTKRTYESTIQYG